MPILAGLLMLAVLAPSPQVEVEVKPPSWVPVPVPLPGHAFGYGYAPNRLAEAGGGEAPRSSATVTTRATDGSVTRTLRVRSGDPRGSATEETVTPRWPAEVARAVTRIQERPDADAAMREGTELFRARRFADAAAWFRRAIPLDPDNGLPRLQYAHALFALADYEGAAHSLRRGLALLPSWPSSGHDLLALYSAPQDFADQLMSLRSHLRQAPDDPDAWLVLGYVRFFTDDHDSATAAFAALPEDDPSAAALRREIARLRPR